MSNPTGKNQFNDVDPGARVLSRVDRSDPVACWLYAGTPSQEYGVVWDRRRRNNIAAHVAVYRYVHGEIPTGHDVHHQCHQKRCVNPAHLTAMPEGDHQRLHHVVTECVHGHAYTPENTIMQRGQKVCRTCVAAHYRQYRQRKRHPCATCDRLCSIRATRCRSCFERKEPPLSAAGSEA